jgi:hypothetical protein
MIVAASKYSAVPVVKKQAPRAPQSPRAPQVVVKRPSVAMSSQQWLDWFHSELRSGRSLDQYFQMKKAKIQQEIRECARKNWGRKQNNRSELEWEMEVPSSLYHYWKFQDPHFWEDKANLKSLRRDNDDLTHCIKT